MILALPNWLPRRLARPSRPVMIALGLVALALLIWFVGPLIAIAGHVPLGSPWVRLAVILVVIGVVVGRWALARWRERQRNRALVAELEGRPAGPPPGQEEVAAADLAAMADRAAAALALMRDAKVGAKGELVYELPWYAIIGPPGAGKTTALKNSGLDFPIAQEVGDGPVRGIGGTRTIEWWFTDRAVLIDTAGRYTTQDSDQAADAGAWRGFLDLLKTHRPRQPLTGLIVALSVADLAGADEGLAIAHGRAVRQRINELQSAFGIRLPVYVLVTKMDLLAGFTEYFDDLSAHEREQVWGETWPFEKATPAKDARLPADAADFGAAFDGLLARLDARTLARMQAEQDMARRGLIFGFPRQFASIREPLGRVLREIGRTTSYETAPLVRGFYFTSGTQFGRPIDRLLGALSNRFGLKLAAGRADGARGRTYFLADLLKRVVFPEAALAGRDPAAERRARTIKLASIGAAAGVAAIVALLWVVSYARNASLIAKLDTQAEQLRKSVAALPQGPVSDSDVTQVLEALGEARALPFASTAPEADRSPGFSWGIGQRGTLRPQVDGAYRNLLNRQLLPRLLLALEDQLAELTGPAPREGQDRRPEIYSTLRLYLMLGRAPRAPLDRGGIAAAFDDRWANAFPGEDQAPVRDALRAHLATLLAGPMQPPRLNATLIAAARERVSSLGPGERVYAQMLADPGLRALPAFTIAEVPGVGNARLFTRRSGKPLTAGIPGMFRRRYFFSSVVPAIGRYASQSANENWVTGEAGPDGGPLVSEAGRVKDALVTTYLADFTRRWDELIDDTVVSGERPMDERLQLAVRPPSPVKALFTAWGAETDLTPPSVTKGRTAGALRVGAIFSPAIYRGLNRANQVSSASAAGGPAPPGPLDEVIAHFRWLHDIAPPTGPSPLDDALIALTAVGDTGTAARSAAGLGDPALQHDKTASAMAATARLGQVAGALPPAAGALFKGFVTASTSQLNRDARAGIKTSYGQQLGPECRSILAQGFPFSPTAAHEASIDDFSRLFRPTGLIDAFQTSNLAGQIDTGGANWGLTQSGRALGLSPAAVRQFQAADRIRRTFFKPGDIRPNVRMFVEPLRIDGDATAVTLTVDGAPVAFTPTDRRGAELRWPGTAPGATLSFQHRGSPTPSVRTWAGDWGFARMLRAARLSNVTSSGFVATIGDGGASVSFRVRMLNTANPFMLRELATFQCPANL